MSFDAAPVGVREAAALAAAHVHPAPPADPKPWPERLRFYVYLIEHDHRFTDWPAKEKVR